MELQITEPRDMADLKEKIKGLGLPDKFYVAVESNIFDENKKWVLMRRGPGCKDGRFKLEGIGGGIEETDTNFIEGLKREIAEEAGHDADIEIKGFLYARTEEVFDLHANINKLWIILSYIAVLKGGEMKIIEPDKNLGYERYNIEEIDTNELTQCANSAYQKIKENLEKVNSIIG